MPQANSTTSWPRVISPRGVAESTLPCSAVMIAASSSLRSLSSSRKRKTIWVRADREVLAQARRGRAGRADDALGVLGGGERDRAVVSPVAGLVTSPVRAAAPSKRAPSVQCGIRGRLLMGSKPAAAAGETR